MPFDVLSPDGISIHRDQTWDTREEALAAAHEWAKRYEAQGYYSTARWEHIPCDEIVKRCCIVAVEADDSEDAEEEFHRGTVQLLGQQLDDWQIVPDVYVRCWWSCANCGTTDYNHPNWFRDYGACYLVCVKCGDDMTYVRTEVRRSP